MENRLCTSMEEDKAVTASDQEEAVRSGRAKLAKLVRAHNRSLIKQWALLLANVIWAPAIALLLALGYYLLGAREVCGPIPLLEPGAFSEEYRLAKTFDDWSARAMRRADSASHATHLQYAVVADLGPTYSRKYRDCLNSHRKKSECKSLYLTRLYVIQPEGFQKAVMLAHANANTRLSGTGMCELRRVSPLLQSLEVGKHVRKKGVASIDRSASSSSQTGDKYYLDKDSQILLPLAADFAENTIELPWSCVGAAVGDHGAMLLVVAAALMVYRFCALKNKFPGGAGKRDDVLFSLASANVGLFDQASTIATVSELILEDIGLSSKFGVLFEDDMTLLSQNWIFSAGGRKLFAAGVHIRTECEKRPYPYETSKRRWVVRDGVSETTGLLLSKKARRHLIQRLGSPTWKDFQVLRQVDLLLFKATGDGGVFRIDPVSFFPYQPSDGDWQAMKLSAAALETMFRGEGPAPTASSPSYPDCAVTHDKAPLFALVEKQVYSWGALRHSLEQKGSKTSRGEVVAYGPLPQHVLALQTDPMSVIIHKSSKFDFGFQEQASQPAHQDMMQAMLHGMMQAMMAQYMPPALDQIGAL